MYHRALLEWFLIGCSYHKVIIFGYVSIGKERKNIAVIINASKSSSHFYCDHFVGAEGKVAC